jgi:hypothetical protein
MSKDLSSSHKKPCYILKFKATFVSQYCIKFIISTYHDDDGLCMVDFLKRHITEVDIKDLMFLVATFVVDRRDLKQLHDSSVDILRVSRNWMR